MAGSAWTDSPPKPVCKGLYTVPQPEASCEVCCMRGTNEHRTKRARVYFGSFRDVGFHPTSKETLALPRISPAGHPMDGSGSSAVDSRGHE